MYNINNIKINLLDATVQRLEDLSDDTYFGSEYKKYISNSSMSLINPQQGGNPTKFLEGFSGKKRNGGALELGTAVHRMILEKDDYYIDDVVKPSPKVCDVMDVYYRKLQEGVDPELAILDACKEADYYAKNVTQTRIDNVLKEGKIYLESLYDRDKCEGCITLTQEHKDKLDKCLASVSKNRNITQLLEGTKFKNGLVFNEDAFVMEFEATLPPNDSGDFEDKTVKHWLKVKIDNWTIDFDNKQVTLNDLKTTGQSISDFSGAEILSVTLDGEEKKTKVSGSFEKFHYYRQMAFYMRVLKAYVTEQYDATEDNGWTFECNMLVVETNDPHYSHVFKVGDRWLNLGTFEYESLLKRIAYHEEYGYNSFTNIKINETTIIW